MANTSKNNKQVALITGSASRIGKDIALHLASMGYRIAIHCNSSLKLGEKLVTDLLKKEVEANLFVCDLKNEIFQKLLIDDVIEQFGRIDLLINNASVFKKNNLKSVSEKKINTDFDIHLKAALFLSQDFARVSKKGNIINILDTNVIKNKTAHLSYLLSKKSLADLTKILAVELAPNIRVNGIAPGLILPPTDKKQEHVQRLAKGIPLKRKGDVKNISQTVEFLLSNDFITGQTIFVDGGEHLI